MIKKSMFLLLIFILITGCVSAMPGDLNIDLMDTSGDEVTLTSFPDRIVIAGKQTPMLANFIYLFDSADDKVIAIENRSQSSNAFLSMIDTQFTEKLTIEKGAGAEQISPAEPDTVLLKASMKDQIGDQLEEIGIVPIYVSFETIEEIYRDTRIIGDLMGNEEKAESIVAFYENTKQNIDNTVSSSPDVPNTLMIQITETDGRFVYSVPSENWLQTVMVEELQGYPVWKDKVNGGGWMEVSIEQIISWQPEIILIINYQGNSPTIIEKLTSDSVWQGFLENSSVSLKPIVYDFQSWDQPDPRWILGYASIARYLHPDSVPASIIYDLVRDFYVEFYGLDLSFINSEIIPDIQFQIE